MHNQSEKSVLLIVAHPDDETLWAGGTILLHPKWDWFVVCLCRKNDKERARKFYKALKILKAKGVMGDLDDGPEQVILDEKVVENAILVLVPHRLFDLVVSHNPTGEYTRHIRHEEVSRAVIELWNDGRLAADELWNFAYEDGNREYLPRPVPGASIYRILTKKIWMGKYGLITETYGFDKNSWEAQTTPVAESFWQYFSPKEAKKRLPKTLPN